MGEAAHGQALIASQKQLLIAMRELEDQMARLEERSNMSRRKTQGRGPRHGETIFGDAPEDGYLEPNPPDPSWITPHHILQTRKVKMTGIIFMDSTLKKEFRQIGIGPKYSLRKKL
ncbi:hypothetical protein F2Q70_00035038 [Brassica cretica]|uniref:Uncharacterized protein n=1 Tax=Brassica cretica TaxID=69181 RepID=A0A8S9G815_BRACR|nr:hypothetical protein F2Q68_00030105 [Brassica cretica]KAF2586824.1 hypothetical protein F2Q70_00035038 [Brassica cretica]